MGCAVSTEAGGSAFDLDRPWRIDERVAVRPEPFGALLYHFGTRRLSFLKNTTVVAVVRSLADHPSARSAGTAVGGRAAAGVRAGAGDPGRVAHDHREDRAVTAAAVAEGAAGPVPRLVEQFE